MAKKLTKIEKQKLNNLAIKHWRIVVAIFVLLAIFLTLAYFMGWLDKFFKKDPPVLSTAGGYSTTVQELKDLEINFLDVGQGDCIIIELPDGKNMIIDSGKYNSCQDVISDFTERNNIDTFDYLLLTHQDDDHAGNMNWVIDNYKVNYIFRPNNYSGHKNSEILPEEFNPNTDGYDSNTKTYSEFMISAYNEKCTVEVFNKDSDFTNEIICDGEKYSYSFNFWTPTSDRLAIEYNDPNNYSPIMSLEYGNKKIMFTGDAELENINEYVETYGSQNNIDVLKVGHHGSENATTQAFVEAIDPEFAIIQCGLNNSYGHPHSETLGVLNSHDGGVTVFRNDTNGTITLSFGINDVINSSSFTLEKADCSGNLIPGVKPSEQELNIKYGDYINNRAMLVA